MKKHLFISILFIVSLNSFSQFSDDLGQTWELPGERKVIYEGWHYCLPFSSYDIWKFNHPNRRFKFRAHMYDNCSYDPDELESDNGWNKVGRISFMKNSSMNKFKMHLGWIFLDDPNEIQFSLFYHNTDEEYFISHRIDRRDFPDANLTVDMYLGEKAIGMIINNEYDQSYDTKCIGIRQDNSNMATSQDSYVMKTFYFGGLSHAPHKMETRFHDLFVDQSGYQTKFNSNDIMTWNLTEFEENDSFGYYANKLINGSVKESVDVQCHSDLEIEKQKCIIKEGAEITFLAGQEVYLHPGFHAKEGSYFKARTFDPAMLKVIEMPTRFAESIEYKTENALSMELSLYVDNTRDSIVFGGQVNIMDSVARINIDSILPNETYYAVADFYSGKGSRKRVEGWIENDNYGLKQMVVNKHPDTDNENFIVYPNPFSGTFSFVKSNGFNVVSLSVRDLKGNTVVKQKITENIEIVHIDISTSPPGLYVLFVETADGTFTEKLIKY